jgi:hypothetical protein
LFKACGKVDKKTAVKGEIRMYRVFDNRTNETLFESTESIDCVGFINSNYDEGDDDFEYIFVEKITE